MAISSPPSSSDLMCEPFILHKTGLTIEDHQKITVVRYARLLDLTNVYVMPVLQGYSPESYAAHVDQYGELFTPGQWVGVGSVCKRNGNPDQIEDILLTIKTQRPDLRVHGFGIKFQALQSPTVRQVLYSSDSMAWSFAGRKSVLNMILESLWPTLPKSRLSSVSPGLFNLNFSNGGTKWKKHANANR